MAADITIRSNVLQKLGKYELRAEAGLLDALDVIAAEVQEHAREGHPKLAPKNYGEPADVLDRLRERTGLASREFKGMLRFLTRTGVTRNSIQKKKAVKEGSGLTRRLVSKVFSAQKHANDLEFGSVGRRAFPFMRPALIAKEARGKFLLQSALVRASGGL